MKQKRPDTWQILPFTKYLLIIALAIQTTRAYAQNPGIASINRFSEENSQLLEKLYRQLHQNPELSGQEEKTSAIMAGELKSLGFEVTEKLGGHSLVGIYKNGEGPVVMVRTDMDALPVEEKTGLPYASKVRGIDATGKDVGVMHACGHDVHMTVFVGTARALIEAKSHWKGTLAMVAQAAEETGVGADLLFKAGLYEKIIKPDYALALHASPYLPAGHIGYREGALMASVDMVDVTVYGQGGHGAAPHTTKDPVVLSAQMILAFQTIVSREINPLDPAVVTVGSIHGGNVHNVIPDEVKLQLTLRAYSREVRDHLVESLKRICKNMAITAGIPEDKLPVVTLRDPHMPATVNDPALTQRLATAFRGSFGADRVTEMPPYMFGEDFALFGLQKQKVPICMFWLGAVDPANIKKAKEEGKDLPALHSPYFAPLPEPTIKAGVRAMGTAVFTLFNNRVN